jgi:non-specific serine/threonine protein kinase
MLETVREYARERLDEAGETLAAHTRHAAHFLDVAERAEQQIHGPGQADCVKRLEADQSNLRAALDWFIAGHHGTDALRMTVLLGRYWAIHGDLSEGRTWFERALAIPTSAPAQVRAATLTGLSNILTEQNDPVAARPHLEHALSLSFNHGRLPDGGGIARKL